MHIVIIILLVLYVIMFIAGVRARTTAWGVADFGSVVGALLLICLALVALHALPGE